MLVKTNNSKLTRMHADGHTMSSELSEKKELTGRKADSDEDGQAYAYKRIGKTCTDICSEIPPYTMKIYSKRFPKLSTESIVKCL